MCVFRFIAMQEKLCGTNGACALATRMGRESGALPVLPLGRKDSLSTRRHIVRCCKNQKESIQCSDITRDPKLLRASIPAFPKARARRAAIVRTHGLAPTHARADEAKPRGDRAGPTVSDGAWTQYCANPNLSPRGQWTGQPFFCCDPPDVPAHLSP